MILYQWQGPDTSFGPIKNFGPVTNFGDELNKLLWPALLPGFFDQNPDTRFLGIGSVLDGRHDRDRGGRAALKLVAGSGYGGYEARIVPDETWIFHWVRGARTARLLGLPPSTGLGDPASLVSIAGVRPLATMPSKGIHGDIGFIPHFESAIRGAWQDVSAAAGTTLIDPRGDPAAIIAAIGKCRMVISEALHGVIVADALRVPWIAIQPLAPIHRAKWADWADTLDLTVAFRRLPPSTTLERAHLSPLSRFHAGRSLLSRHAMRLRDVARDRHVDEAAEALRAITGEEPRLSGATSLDRGQSRMMDAIVALRRAPMLGWRSGRGPAAATPLHRGTVSAYDAVSAG
jgi:succinoglycan biosynthesis protein ExoV